MPRLIRLALALAGAAALACAWPHQADTPRPAKARFLEGRFGGKYSYNATRDPWRIGTDALLNDDATSRAQARTMSAWVQAAAGGDPQRIRAGYGLDGRPLPGSKYFTIVFAAPFGVAAMTEPAPQQWLNDVYDSVRGVNEDYYEDSVTLLCLLVMTGNYWDPTTIGSEKARPCRPSGC